MRLSGLLCAGLCLVAASAHADPTAPELQAQGEDLAKQGRFTEAIDSFKAADKLQPSATHACLIALAYTRRELWPQAEIWLSQCKVRATAADPLPDWAPAAEDQIQQRLADANAAAVTIEVQPAEASAKLTASSFAPDEQFAPRTIHLPFGMHTIVAKAPGYVDETKQVEVKDKAAQHIVITMHKPDAGKPIGVVGPAPAPSNGGKKLMIAGGVIIAAGFATWGWMAYERSKLETTDPKQWDAHSTRFDIAEYSTIGLWAVGAGLVVYGYIKHSKHEETSAIAVAPVPGGGIVSLGWVK